GPARALHRFDTRASSLDGLSSSLPKLHRGCFMSLHRSLPAAASLVSLVALVGTSCSSPSTGSGDSEQVAGAGQAEPSGSASGSSQEGEATAEPTQPATTGVNVPVQGQSAGADVDPNAIVVERPED